MSGADDIWEDVERLFAERKVCYRGKGELAVPGVLERFAIDELASCEIPFAQADKGALLLLDSAKANLVFVGALGIYGVDVVGRACGLRGSPLEAVVKQARPVSIDDDQAISPKGPPEEGSIGGALRAASAAFAPLFDGESCTGVISLFCRERLAAFTESDLSRLARKGRQACREIKKLMARPDVSHWYHALCEALQPEPYSEEDVHMLLEVFGTKLTTKNPALAKALTADVAEGARGVGVRIGAKEFGGAKRYSAKELKTVLRAFGVEVTAGNGRLADVLTMDLADVLRRRPKSGEEEPGQG